MNIHLFCRTVRSAPPFLSHEMAQNTQKFERNTLKQSTRIHSTQPINIKHAKYTVREQ